MASAVNPVVQERRAGGHAAIDRFVSERADMLSRYWKVAGLFPFEDEQEPGPRSYGQTVTDLRDFCEVLVDYIASGHFVLYERIASGQERRRAVAELASSLYPEINRLTQTVIGFNDKYDALVQHSSTELDQRSIENLNEDLSQLGEALADRIELEDQLIAKLMEGRG